MSFWFLFFFYVGKPIVLLFFFFFSVMLGLHCCSQAFSSCGKQRLLFVEVHGFSLMWLLLLQAQAPGAGASVVASCGLSRCGAWALVALKHEESSWTRERTFVSCIGRWIPILCITREVPVLCF